MIRWNAGFIRGLAESVLARARVIRGSLSKPAGPPEPADKKRKRKKAAVKRARTPSRPNG